MGTALVTGANRGIGLELCRQLAARGDRVIAACRRSSPELDELGVRVEPGIEVTDATSLAALRDRLAAETLDLLVNNAGIGKQTTLDGLDIPLVRQLIEVNAIGPLLMTATVLPLMRAGGKIAIITSRMGSIGDNTTGGWYGYRMSKAAVNAVGVSLAHDLRGRGIAVAILHPGMVKTDMTRALGAYDAGIEPGESVRGLLARIDALTLETSGSFWHGVTGEILPW